MYNIDSSGKVTSSVRSNFTDYISSYSDDNFKIIRVGNENSIHFKFYGNIIVEALVPIDDVIKSFNEIKKNIVRVNDPINPGEKSKPSFFIFDFSKNEVSASGPNDKNKTETFTQKISKEEILNFLKLVVQDYKNIVDFEIYGNKVDSNKHKKHIDKLDKFINKEY